MKKIILITMLLFGCAYHVNPNAWTGGPTEQINKDFGDCDLYSSAHSDSNPLIASEILTKCMLNKGYTPKR